MAKNVYTDLNFINAGIQLGGINHDIFIIAFTFSGLVIF